MLLRKQKINTPLNYFFLKNHIHITHTKKIKRKKTILMVVLNRTLVLNPGSNAAIYGAVEWTSLLYSGLDYKLFQIIPRY